MATCMSDYERQRQENIRRNLALLESLGIGSNKLKRSLGPAETSAQKVHSVHRQEARAAEADAERVALRSARQCRQRSRQITQPQGTCTAPSPKAAGCRAGRCGWRTCQPWITRCVAITWHPHTRALPLTHTRPRLQDYLRRQHPWQNAGCSAPAPILSVCDGVPVLATAAVSTPPACPARPQRIISVASAPISAAGGAGSDEEAAAGEEDAPLPRRSIKHLEACVGELVRECLGREIAPPPGSGQMKCAVMRAACAAAEPVFSLQSGVQLWRNAIMLFINVGGGTYPNMFTPCFSTVTWFTSLPPRSPAVTRLLAQAGAAPEPVLLFCRRVGGAYVFCGRLKYVRHEDDSHPILFQWRLLDVQVLLRSPAFVALFFDDSAAAAAAKAVAVAEAEAEAEAEQSADQSAPPAASDTVQAATDPAPAEAALKAEPATADIAAPVAANMAAAADERPAPVPLPRIAAAPPPASVPIAAPAVLAPVATEVPGADVRNDPASTSCAV